MNSEHSTDTAETTPLMSKGGNYYFLQPDARKDSIPRETIEILPEGTTQDEFASRPVHGAASTRQNKRSGFLSSLFGRRKGSDRIPLGGASALMKNRKAAIKVEPKVFFANERTFLAWLHVSCLLAGTSIAISSFAQDNIQSQLYGLVLLPISIGFIGYAMYQYASRAQMIRRRSPGPYESLVGPVILSIALMLSIIAQFTIKLFSTM